MIKSILIKLQNWIFFWIWATLMFLIAWITYSAITPIAEVSTWTALQASEYNKLVQKLNRIDEEQLITAWVNFDWTNCTWWTLANECVIRGSYNISSVTYESTGLFILNFINPLDKNNNAVSITADWWWVTGAVWFVNNFSLSSPYDDLDNTKLWISIRDNDTNGYSDRTYIAISIVWWKL